MIPRVDPLYLCSRFIWHLCFPLAWAVGRFTRGASSSLTQTRKTANFAALHREPASVDGICGRLYAAANVLTLIVPLLASIAIGVIGDVLARSRTPNQLLGAQERNETVNSDRRSTTIALPSTTTGAS